MTIWIDGDACPREIKDLLFRTATRRNIPLVLVANQSIQTPKSPLIRTVVVRSGMNEADRHIVDEVAAGDLVVTADIPLAAEVVQRKAFAINPRGEAYSEENISERLATRNMLDELRGSGNDIGGPPPFTAQNKQAFANELDRWATRFKRLHPERDNPPAPDNAPDSSE